MIGRVDRGGLASSHGSGRWMADCKWTAFVKHPRCGMVKRGTEQFSDRERRDIGIRSEDVTAKFIREIAKLQRTIFQ